MKRDVNALTDGMFDLLVIGGGITGAGVALDAVTRGLRVALIDKGDFASGTSSASSKLVHGGLRYLERAEFRLVYEALQERRLLLRNVPHLVRPLRFLLPFYRGARVPAWKWQLGLTLYDFLAGRDNLDASRRLSLKRLREDAPALRPEGLTGGAAYFDAQMEDARLCVEVLRTAVEHGANAANYVEAVAFEKGGVRVYDHVGDREMQLNARMIVNATGPWGDVVCRLAGDAGVPHLQATKGVHLVVRDLGLSAAFLLLHPRDGRVFFVIPWLGKTLIGTTDTEHPGSPDDVTATTEDVAYLLEGYNRHLNPPLSDGDVISAFAGLRPLMRSKPGDPSSRSREYALLWTRPDLLTVIGGKYTTYRAMAEAIVDAVAARLGCRERSRTKHLRLDGAPPGNWNDFQRTEQEALCGGGLSEATAAHLVGRYGRRAAEVAAYVQRDPALARPIADGEPDVEAELIYQRDCEMALSRMDSLMRRMRLGLFRPDLV